MESTSLLAAVWEMSLRFSPEQTKESIRDRSLFIAGGGGGGGGGARILGGSLDFWENKRGDRWKLWKDSEGGPLKFALKMKTWAGVVKVVLSY